MTDLHPDVTAALAALNRVAAAWGFLADQVEHGPQRRGEGALSRAAAARADRLAREERADRTAIVKAGAVPTGTTRAPQRVAVLDAQALVLGAVIDSAWKATSALRGQTVSVGPQLTWTPSGADQERFVGAVAYLRIATRRVPHSLAAQIAEHLGRVDQVARAVAGVGNDRRRLKAPCPACGRRSLDAEVGPVDQREWYITCPRPECRCQGRDCGCGLPLRYPRMRHVWPSHRFGELAGLLERREAA